VQVQEVTRFYEPLAAACSRVYFALHAMAELHPLYQVLRVSWVRGS